MLRTSVLVAGVMGAMAASAEATFVTGARAFFTGAISTSNESPGAAPGTFTASVSSVSPAPVASASASLVWGATSYAFTGAASGAVGSPLSTFANSQGIAMFTFATAMNVTMSWNLNSVTGTSSTALAGWSLDDVSSGITAYAIQFTGTSTTPSSVTGGISTTTSATGVTGQIAAGTYLLATAIQIAA
ncbi:MAG: hypothetical protein ACKOHI_11215, partial [Phycisphaerales bacterium]